jgi:NADH dehydrogenase
VIIGGGLGGLFCAMTLRDAEVDVVVVDRANHYLYQALIYQVATAELDAGEVSMPIRERLGRQKNTYVVMAEVTCVDTELKQVRLSDDRALDYDFLVIATGLEVNYFGHDEWQPFAPTLKTLRDAVDLRERILSSFEHAEALRDPSCCPELTTFVLVGAGPTGVELAGALAEMVRDTLPREFKRFDPTTTRIILAEAGDRVLPSFSPEISAKVLAKLRKMGVEVRLNSPVDLIDAKGAVVAGERIASDNVIWTAGVRATPTGEAAGLEIDAMGRVVVGPDLTAPGHPDIYAIGDVAHIDREGGSLPAVAQVAVQTAKYVGHSIIDRVESKPAQPPFSYYDKGYLATVGRNYAVLETANGRVKLAGYLAKMIWAFIHLLYQMPNQDKTTMFVTWTWSYVTHRLGSRVIIGRKSRP